MKKIIDQEIILHQIPVLLNIGISFVITEIIGIGIFLSLKVIRLQNIKQGFQKSVKVTYPSPIFYGSIFMILIWRWNMLIF
jgi:hypothetical protein